MEKSKQYKLTYFEIKENWSGPTTDKYFDSESKLRQFITRKRNTLADIVVYDLHDRRVVTSEYKTFLNSL